MAHFKLEKFSVRDERGSVSYFDQYSTTESEVSCDQKWLEANKAHKVTVEEGTLYLVPIEDNSFLVVNDKGLLLNLSLAQRTMENTILINGLASLLLQSVQYKKNHALLQGRGLSVDQLAKLIGEWFADSFPTSPDDVRIPAVKPTNRGTLLRCGYVCYVHNGSLIGDFVDMQALSFDSSFSFFGAMARALKWGLVGALLGLIVVGFQVAAPLTGMIVGSLLGAALLYKFVVEPYVIPWCKQHPYLSAGIGLSLFSAAAVATPMALVGVAVGVLSVAATASVFGAVAMVVVSLCVYGFYKYKQNSYEAGSPSATPQKGNVDMDGEAPDLTDPKDPKHTPAHGSSSTPASLGNDGPRSARSLFELKPIGGLVEIGGHSSVAMGRCTVTAAVLAWPASACGLYSEMFAWQQSG